MADEYADEEYAQRMSDALNQNQFRPGEGYTPDIKTTAGMTAFACTSCGSRYQAPVKMPPQVTQLSNCRNQGCPGPVVRT